MTTLTEYFKWRGNLSFKQAPLNEVDALIFTQLCYIPYEKAVSTSFDDEGITIKQFYEDYVLNSKEKMHMGALLPSKKILILLKFAATSERFANVKLRAYVRDIDLTHEKQFCAICFDLPNNTTYVCFCGTDDTIVGWKEDLNMALFTPIPSQDDSVAYLNALGDNKGRKIYIGGHSKGGNLAVYSAFMAKPEVQKNIIFIFNFDGPGFKYDFLKEARKKPVLAKRVLNLLPESSIIGAIFDTIGARVYVKCRVKGFLQHDLFTWYIQAPDTLYTVPSLAKSSIQFHNTLEQWVHSMTDEQKVEFVNAFYKLCKSNNSETLTDILSNKTKFAIAIFNVDEKSKKILFKTMAGSYVKGYFKSPTKKPVSLVAQDDAKLRKVPAIEKATKKKK